MSREKVFGWSLFALSISAIASLNVFVYQQKSKMDAMVAEMRKTTIVVAPVPEPEFNPITFAQALALLEDPQDQPLQTDLQKEKLGTGVLGKKVHWTGSVSNVVPSVYSDSPKDGSTIMLKPSTASEHFAQAVFPKTIDLSALNREARVSVDCVVTRVSMSFSYVLYCDAYTVEN